MESKESIFSHDLISELRRNPRKSAIVQKTIDRVGSLQRDVASGKAQNGDVSRAMAELVKVCGFNFGLLMPYIFPKFRNDEYGKAQPLQLTARPFMFVMTTASGLTEVTLRAGRQVGKCADEDTEVITNRGKMTLGEIFNAGLPV